MKYALVVLTFFVSAAAFAVSPSPPMHPTPSPSSSPSAGSKTFEGLVAVGQNAAPATGRSSVFVWSEGKKIWTSPAGESWVVVGAQKIDSPAPKPDSKPSSNATEKLVVRFWGWKSIGGGSQPYFATLEIDRKSDSKSNPKISVQSFEKTKFELERMALAGSWRVLSGRNAFGGQIVELWNSQKLVGSWSWESDVRLNQLALKEDGTWAACGFESEPPVPFLWYQEKIDAPEGWRGRMETVKWTSSGLWALGRGAPGQQVPVQPLLFQNGGWQTLSVESAGSFPLLLDEVEQTSEDTSQPAKVVPLIVGLQAQKSTGALQLWSLTDQTLDVKPSVLSSAHPGGILADKDGGWKLWGTFAEKSDETEKPALWNDGSVEAFEGLEKDDRIVTVFSSAEKKK